MNKVKVIILAAVFAIMGNMYCGGRTVRDFFVSSPIDELLTVSRTARLDMLDYIDNNMDVNIANNMGSDAHLVWVDSTSMAIETSEAQLIELLMLTHGRSDTVLVVISTVSAPVEDSRITCYNPLWHRLKPLIEVPSVADFVKSTATAQQRELLERVMPFGMVSMHIEGENRNQIVARHQVEGFVAPEDYKQLKDALIDSITFDIPTLTKRINHRYVNTYL